MNLFLLPLAARMILSPETVYECSSGAPAQVVVRWASASGPVEVRVGSPQGPSMTGVVAAAGRAESGNWVTDGMTFYLVNASGQVEASAVARLRCLENGIAPGNSYLPLAVGNWWTYRVNTRASTGTYVTRRVTGVVTAATGQAYYVLQEGDGVGSASATPPPLRLREDAAGRVWRLADSGAGEELYFDPAAAGGSVQVVASPLEREVRTYARGVGLVRSSKSLLTGSSGGFTGGLELVEASLDGGVSVRTAAPGFSLAVEDTVLDVTNRKVPNCAVPAYCVACGLFADPPGTYKPCARVRVESTGLGLPRQLAIALRDASGAVVWRGEESEAAPGARYERMMLGGLAPGAYRLTAEARDAAGQVASADVAIRIE